MNETEKKFMKYLKLDYGLQYKDRSFIHTEPLIHEGQLKIEEYTKIHIYEPTKENQTSTWDIIPIRFQTLECENIEHPSDYLPREYLKLIIPVLKITYVGNLLNSFKSYAEKSDINELCQHFLAETVLVGGGLIIRNASNFKDKSKLDILKAHMIWTIDKTSLKHKYKKSFEKTSGDYVNQLFSYEKFSVIAYEKVIPAFTKLDEKLLNSHEIPADWSASINKRLVPGITSFHKEQDINYWLINNITTNLPNWIEKYHMENGLLVTQNGLKCSKEKAIEFLCEPEFKFIESTSLKMFHIKNQIELLMNINRIDINEKQVFEINPFALLDLSDKEVDAIACNIIQEQLKIQINTEKNKFKVSNQFKNVIKKALKSKKPYTELINIFNKYGHYFCKNYILGKCLESVCYSYPELPTELLKIFQKPKELKERDELIEIWKIFQSKFNVNAFSGDRSVVKSDNIERWLNENNSTYPETWYVVNRSKLIPIWELLDSNIQEQIRELIKNEERILMTGEERIGNEIKYHRIEFDTPLRSNKYHIIGSVVTIDYKKTNLTVKFRLMDCYGFFAIIEDHKNLNDITYSGLKICWALIGVPLNLDYFNYELSRIKLDSGNKKIEMSKKSVSDTIKITKSISQNLIFATIFEFPSTNFEPTIEVIISTSTSRQINYTLINHKFEDIEPWLENKQDPVLFEYYLKWYIIDISGYGSLFWNSNNNLELRSAYIPIPLRENSDL
ncbi:21176_t:CDS:2 [Cetraspora pellucida]|uniref:21176_t:CDS:1 n=1 Tax=Cetraspora pellucida TaxID=1433469 RepID=A0A9N8ZD78_9GLOM|nr:21176_t:CDS:2 [Cetraspora pellucida]